MCNADDEVARWLDLSNETPLGEELLLDLERIRRAPMDRAMDDVLHKDLVAIDPEARS